MYWEGCRGARQIAYLQVKRRAGERRNRGVDHHGDPHRGRYPAPLLKGVHPKVVQELLGHATINITLDTYSHVLPEMGDAAPSAMNDALD